MYNIEIINVVNTSIGFSQQGVALDNEDLLSLANMHQLNLPIPDYLSEHFRQVLDIEVVRIFGPGIFSKNLRYCRDIYIHLVNFCRHSGDVYTYTIA